MRYLSYVLRPGFLLLIGLAAGYYFGFTAGARGGDSIGLRVAQAVRKVSPDQISAEEAARAARIRDTIHARAGVITR